MTSSLPCVVLLCDQVSLLALTSAPMCYRKAKCKANLALLGSFGFVGVQDSTTCLAWVSVLT